MGALRLFFAVAIPEEIKARIATLCAAREIEAPARWVRPGGYHLTLRFLGETLEDRLPGLTEALQASAGQVGPFGVSFASAGAFPNKKRARVLWLGIQEGAEALCFLANGLEGELAALGFSPEKRPFKPHLTVGRLKKPSFAGPWCGPISPIAFQADRIILYKSMTFPTGAEYEEMGSAILYGGSMIELSSKEDRNDR